MELAQVRAHGDVVEPIRILAERQRGFLSRGQLLAAGIDRHAIDRLITARRLLPVHRGVYAVSYRPAVYLGAETAALLAVREGGVLSHDSAMMLWGLRPTWAPAPRLIHVTVPGVSGGRPAGVVVHRSQCLRAGDVSIHQSLSVTSPARALLDIAASATRRELERCFDQALIKKVATPDLVRELLGRSGTRAGRSALRDLLEEHTTTTFTRSVAEERFLALVRQADLPRPLTNARRHGYEIDFLWPDQNLAVEIDGHAYHGTGGAYERDRVRDAKLQGKGVRTGRVTWRALRGEPMAVVARVAQAFGAAPR